MLLLFGDRKPFPYLQTRANEHYGLFSPDGRQMAYVSNESGRDEVYLAAFPDASGKRQISTNGGNYPRWRRDGKEIFYVAPSGMLTAVAVRSQGASIDVTSAQPLFATRTVSDYPYDVSADGQRFLIITLPEDNTAAGITVTLNSVAGDTP